jgi:hypothetical protein
MCNRVKTKCRQQQRAPHATPSEDKGSRTLYFLPRHFRRLLPPTGSSSSLPPPLIFPMGSASSRSSGISHAPARQARLTFLGTTTPDTSRTDLSVSPTNAGFPAFSLFILIHNTTLVKDTLGSQHEAIHGATPPSPPDTWVATLVELPRLLRCKCPRHSPNFPRNDMGLNGGDPRDQP